MANLKRTKRLINRHEADLNRLKQFYTTSVKRMNELREQSAQTVIGLKNNIKTVEMETAEKLEVLANSRDTFKARISATTSHIEALKLTLVDEEEEATEPQKS